MSITETIKDTIAANPFTAGVIGGVAATLTTVGVIKLANKILINRQDKKLANTIAAAEAATSAAAEKVDAAAAAAK